MAAATAKELAALAESLTQALADVAKTATAMNRHIEAEGLKIGGRLGVQHAKAADERIKGKEAELQRATDLVAELRRQMEPLLIRNGKYFQLDRVIRAARRRGERTVPVETLLDIINAPAKPDGKEN